MTRSKIRENVFKMLFRVEFHDKSELAEQMELLNDELTNPTDEERQYIDEKCSAIIEHMAELDALIDEKSTGWKTNRMAKVDLAIIRLAVYEIKFEDDIPTKVSINEAVELAKRFGTDKSRGFINGILDKMLDKAKDA